MEREIFTNIYKKHIWGDNETLSGSGSRLTNTINLRNNLKYLINILDIKKILDVPYGDMNYMSHVDLSGVMYYGFDIVEELIQKNREKFKNYKNMHFKQSNAIVDDLPNVDLILCRDLIIHFPINEIWKLLDNFVRSSSKYLLITKYNTDMIENPDNKFGSHGVPRNLQKAPFNFPRPLFEILDKDADGYCASLVLYKISNIKPFINNYFRNHDFNAK